MLVDYSKSHVMTTIEYLEIMRQKAIKKNNYITYQRRQKKGWREWNVRRKVELLNVVERIVDKQVDNQAKVFFNGVWSIAHVKTIRKRFHCNIQASCTANPIGDTSGNCSIFREAHREARAKTKPWMLAKGLVTTRLWHCIPE